MNPKENLLAAIEGRRPEWVPCPLVDGSMLTVNHSLAEYPSGGSGEDSWGVEWVAGEEKAGAGLPRTHPIDKPEMVEDFPLPDADDPDLMEPALEKMEELDRSRSLIFGENGWGIFERAWILVGMERLFNWTYRHPQAVKRLMERIAAVKATISRRFVEEVGVDGVRYGDDWGGDEALLMSPKTWREFIKPGQRELYRVAKEGDAFIHQHSDGKIEEIIPDLIELGLDILNPLQPGPNDVEKVKARFGRALTFHGAVSSRLLDRGSPEQVKEEVKLRIEQLGEGGGYILAPAHGLSYPKENLRAFREAAIQFGRIPSKWVSQSVDGGVDGAVEV